MNVTNLCVLIGVLYLFLAFEKHKDKTNKALADYQSRFDEVNNSLLSFGSGQKALQEQIDCIVDSKENALIF